MNGIFWQATLGIFFIFAMTSLGSAVALFLGDRPISKGFSFIGGLSAGIMLASAVWSLILPALGDGENLLEVVIGFGVGLTAFSLLGIFLREDETAGYKRLFIAITAHNVPEGLSVGFAYGAAATGAVVFIRYLRIFDKLSIYDTRKTAILETCFSRAMQNLLTLRRTSAE